LEDLERALNSETKAVNIRLREGEYQFSLAKAIATSELELVFPDAKALVKKLYGERRAEDPQFVAKIQTILKKMEKMGIVKILPKEKPWELQRYALHSFKFQDVEKNEVVLATEAEVEKARALMHSHPNAEHTDKRTSIKLNTRIALLTSAVIISFIAILWILVQSTINLPLFITTFCLAAVSSTILGISIARRK
jgi:hypothetical protein